MSSTFFYSSCNCPICSPTLHTSFLDMSSTPSEHHIPMDQYEVSHIPKAPSSQATAFTPVQSQARPARPTLGSRQTSDSSIASTSSQGSVFSSASSNITSATSYSSLSSKSLRKAISKLSLRRKSSEAQIQASHTERKRCISAPIPIPITHPTTADLIASGMDAGIHPYNFFEASLHMGADYTVLEDGWLRLRTESHLSTDAV